MTSPAQPNLWRHLDALEAECRRAARDCHDAFVDSIGVLAMKLNWNSRISSSVSAKLDALLRYEQTGSDEKRRVARSTKGLPVYFDLSGALAFTPDGVLLYFNSESEQAAPMKDDRWFIIAAVSAAEEYPDLREMLPERPLTAKTCSVCSGTGRQFQVKAFCGSCSGLGWIP